ncbi:PfaB family protein [Photobacterium lipolyticum]|uniref:PfaB family protein n=1 Tax=Photobacterium lipolyticum TaxID=266810 RepID=A0A2T3N105_9GAMM|nr:PfaB family protein [Photobacterium lipolyticum]PSW05951.1 PfaB family protein [Photobacterium lipolyticum]
MADSSNKAMPLRIALLAQPAHAAGLSADCFSTLPPIEIISVGDNFETALQTAIQVISQGKVVLFCVNGEHGEAQPRLLMLAGLTAAQNKIHPHAYLSGFSANSEHITVDCTKEALVQSRRQEASLSNQQTFDALTAEQKFTALYQMVEAIASRTLNSRSNKESSSHYWFTEPHKARVARLTFNADVCTSSLVLTQATGLKTAQSMLSPSRLFFIVTGHNEAVLSTQLAQLTTRLNELSDDSQLLIELMADNLRQFQADASMSPSLPAIVLQGASVAAIEQEITAISHALPKIMAEKNHYKTPAGSCFSPAPNSKGGVAFVYPGVGTVYPDMFCQFHQYFPELFARLEREGNLKEMLQAEKTYGDNAAEMSLSELAIAGVGSSYLLTQLLCGEFAVKPDFALGYSKGEASMWASLGVWKNPHALIEMTQTSPIFTTAISGELTAVREAWQLSDGDEITWNSFVVRCEPAAIEALLPEFPHAYLAIIQGDTCVLAGCENDCRALLKKLGKRGIAANRVTAMHTTPALSQHRQVAEFYHQPLCDELPEHIRFISAAAGRNTLVNIDSQSIADSIADTFCSTLDFTALIRSAREQGARLFVEIGADRQTCTLIDKINRADHVTTESCTVAANAKGGNDILTLLKCIGQLISHQVPLSLDPLLKGLEQYQVNASTPEITLKGEPV